MRWLKYINLLSGSHSKAMLRVFFVLNECLSSGSCQLPKQSVQITIPISTSSGQQQPVFSVFSALLLNSIAAAGVWLWFGISACSKLDSGVHNTNGLCEFELIPLATTVYYDYGPVAMCEKEVTVTVSGLHLQSSRRVVSAAKSHPLLTTGRKKCKSKMSLLLKSHIKLDVVVFNIRNYFFHHTSVY